MFTHTRLITKRKEIDVKSIYLNLGSGKVTAVPFLHTFFRGRYKGILFVSRKKEMLVIFQKVNKAINNAFASLGTTMKLIDETIARLEKFFCLLYKPLTKMKKF